MGPTPTQPLTDLSRSHGPMLRPVDPWTHPPRLRAAPSRA